jgi:hypothetical protein
MFCDTINPLALHQAPQSGLSPRPPSVMQFRRVKIGQADLSPLGARRPQGYAKAVPVANVGNWTREHLAGPNLSGHGAALWDQVARISKNNARQKAGG